MERLDITHLLLVTSIEGELHLAPIGDNPKRILDVGTGTGIWAIEMGDKYPSAWVLGNDLSPIQPFMVPPNVHFEVDDIEKRWMYKEPFTKPGGWVEFQDFDLQYYSEDGSLRPDHNLYRWISDLLEASTLAGREPCPGPKLEGWVRGAGFQNVHHEKRVLPVGGWPKDITQKQLGYLNYEQLNDGLEAFSLRLFTKTLGWTTSDIHVMLAHVRKDMKDKRIHA
ncbi:MAG: hypothetical protein M1839_002166, partial [Geoglossum umbratile]